MFGRKYQAPFLRADIAATPDGGFLMTDLAGVRRVSADGTTSRVVSARDAGLTEDGTVFYPKGALVGGGSSATEPST